MLGVCFGREVDGIRKEASLSTIVTGFGDCLLAEVCFVGFFRSLIRGIFQSKRISAGARNAHVYSLALLSNPPCAHAHRFATAARDTLKGLSVQF